MKIRFLFLLFLILFGIHNAEGGHLNLYQQRDQGHLRPTHIADMPANDVFFKIGQGFTYARLLDQRMSNLHYVGPGVVLSFSRYAENARYRTELNFAGIGFQLLNPQHAGTTVNNPFIEIHYSHLRKLNIRSLADYYVGG